ncbi:MAG TPA: hypothetical protein VEI96_08915, partial [Thermodesulfovibrionales bacterium]|nr:hypothetical protein [Thermodesulfovibrionales bacterium]
KNKFEKVNLAARAVQNGVASGADYQQFGELLQKLSAEIMVGKRTVTSEEERELLKEYSDLLQMYQDGFLLWKYKREFSSHDFVPKGRIYVGQDVEPLVGKYRLLTESHIYGPTQQPWKSISEDSIRIIWSNANSQFDKIQKLLTNQT